MNEGFVTIVLSDEEIMKLLSPFENVLIIKFTYGRLRLIEIEEKFKK